MAAYFIRQFLWFQIRKPRKPGFLGNIQRSNSSVAPEILEPGRRQFGVSDGMLDRAMPKPILDRPRVMPFVGQRVATGVPQHVDVDRGMPIEVFSPMRFTRRLTASVVNGVFLSLVNTKVAPGA
jgi:hypothetical protein